MPRALDAYAEPEKWEGWIFATRGHGPEWKKVLHVGVDDHEAVWIAITQAVLEAPVHKILDRGQDGLVCGVDVKLTIGGRSAQVRTSWHYERPGAAPRLVTAYPRP